MGTWDANFNGKSKIKIWIFFLLFNVDPNSLLKNLFRIHINEKNLKNAEFWYLPKIDSHENQPFFIHKNKLPLNAKTSQLNLNLENFLH